MLNNNPYHHLKQEMQKKPEEQSFDIQTLIPEFVQATGATPQEAQFFLAATQKLESAIQLYKDTKQ